LPTVDILPTPNASRLFQIQWADPVNWIAREDNWIQYQG